MRRCILVMVLAGVVGAGLLSSGCDPPDVKVKESPIQIVSETIGHGREARAGDVVCIGYRVLLPDGEEVLRDDEFSFTLGAGAVIAGFDDSIPGMRPGGKRIVKCPPHKHWGSIGYGDGAIPPHTTLTLHIKLISIE